MTSTAGPAHGHNLAATIASGDAVDIREFAVDERMNALFRVDLVVLSENPDIDFEAVVGLPAQFSIRDADHPRTWSGIVSRLQQTAVEPRGLSTYELTIVPSLWLATQRRNYRIFQQLSELDIALAVLSEWGARPAVRVASPPKKRKYRVQYGESDFTFVSRMLEDAGVSFHFEDGDGDAALVLTDAPQTNEPRAIKIPYRDRPTAADREHVTHLEIGRQVRPGRYTMRDHDYRRPPSFDLAASATASSGDVEGRLERYHYTPGAFLFVTDKGEGSPVADDKGKSRTDEAEGAALAQKRLEAKRGAARICTFDTTALDLAPGVVVNILDHPRTDLGENRGLLIVASALRGRSDGDWHHHCEARGVDAPYRPPLATRRPRIAGVESATVVGPAGEEIHTDEFGRVRVQFHWDREGRMDDNSSCWIHVSQPWGGAGFGGVNLPRVGQEVIVDFLGGDPDRPIITGRVYTGVQKVPYGLPANKTQSGWKSSSTHNTGGYNELMFEDAAGRELVRIQAERDLHKLVKHDEQRTVRHDRKAHVGHDEHAVVGHDRTRVVENDETITIKNDRTRIVERDERITVKNDREKTVEHDERVTIKNDREKTVEHDERVTIKNDRTKSVEHDERVTIGNDREQVVLHDEVQTVKNNRTRTVERDERLTVRGSRTRQVEHDEKVTVGKSRTKVVKHNEDVRIGGNLSQQIASSLREVVGLAKNQTVGLSRSAQIGKVDSIVVGESHSVMVMKHGEFGHESCSSSFFLGPEKCAHTTKGFDGKTATITMEGSTITLQAVTIKIVADHISMDGTSDVTITTQSGDTIIKGGPKVKLNPP